MLCLTKPAAGAGLNEEVAPMVGGPPNMGGQGQGQVVVEEPNPDDLQVDAYNHLLGTVQEMKETLGELYGVLDAN